ncbi:hypothetical protein WS9_015455 [Paraclostridium sordellii 8483]|uniref:hypothetical protein n=1 Tax=Paraclostridium sordellii TaxID=1505 RepID=UPI0002F548E1|nr:hypothetical protein [Paeniclostridium sordellii]TAN63739.1 hypothetical protein WS9_015455 [Paeniclostridium sordellii 8483]
MQKIFYTIMRGNKFLNNNLMKESNENINEAVRFKTLEEAKQYYKDLRKDIGFKIVKVNCELKVVE